jgi:hypothetical protein
MSVKGEEMSKLHRAKKLFDGVLSSLKKKANDIDVDGLKQRGMDVASSTNQKIDDYDIKGKFDTALDCAKKQVEKIELDEIKAKVMDVASSVNQKVEDYDVKSKLETVMEGAKKQADKIEIDEIKAKVVDTASKAEADITGKVGKFKQVARERKERIFATVKLKLQKVWRVTKWVLIIVLAGTVVGMFLPPGNPVAKSSCYASGIAYYTAIGSFPTLSTGESAMSKVSGMCARSGGIAFEFVN